MIKRIQEIIDNYNLNASQFADRLGVQRSGISHILNGRNKPSLDFVIKILEHFDEVNTDWLIKGTGSMFDDTTQIATPKDIPGNNAMHRVSEPDLFASAFSPEPVNDQDLSQSQQSPEIEKNSKDSSKEDESDSEVREPITDEDTENVKSKGRKTERILVFYNDRTYREYLPEDAP